MWGRLERPSHALNLLACWLTCWWGDRVHPGCSGLHEARNHTELNNFPDMHAQSTNMPYNAIDSYSTRLRSMCWGGGWQAHHDPCFDVGWTGAGCQLPYSWFDSKNIPGNSRSHESSGFEMFGKVEGGWAIAKSIRDLCPIFLDVLETCKSIKYVAPVLIIVDYAIN